jgi:hypothetical protein
MKTFRNIKTLRTLAIVFGFIILGLIVWDLSGPAVYRRRAAGVRVGDDKARVRAIMGAPTETSTGGGGLAQLLVGWPPEQWIYGRALDWQTPVTREYPWIRSPVLLDFHFSPRADDVAVSFNSIGKVTRVEIPK